MTKIPDVPVPMNFGKHLLQITGFNDLSITVKGGLVLKANSLILSLNSPVLMRQISGTGSLELNLKEFSEDAVKRFIYSCYTGDATGQVSREGFRDFNKIAVALDVAWLRKSCLKFYREMCERLDKESLEEAQFLCDEAGFVFSEANDKSLLRILSKKLKNIPDVKRSLLIDFVENKVNALGPRYPEMYIALAGFDAHVLYETLSTVLQSRKEESGTVTLTETEQWLLSLEGIARCKHISEPIFERLICLLEDSTDGKIMSFLWKLFRFLRKIKLPQLLDSIGSGDEGCSEVYSAFLDGSKYLKCETPTKLLEMILEDDRVMTYEMVLDAVLFWEFYKCIQFKDGWYNRETKTRVKEYTSFFQYSTVVSKEDVSLLDSAMQKFGRPRSVYTVNRGLVNVSSTPFSNHCWQMFEPEDISRVIEGTLTDIGIPKLNQPTFLISFNKERDYSFLISSGGNCKYGEGKCFVALHLEPASDKAFRVTLVEDTTTLSRAIGGSCHFHEDIDMMRIHLYLSFKIHKNYPNNSEKLFTEYIIPLSWWPENWTVMTNIFNNVYKSNVSFPTVQLLMYKPDSMCP